ncbi:hypothetical protein [Endozoicomonas acroporae]|uniref:hypothetical protein n=1 Tax=Endozoicomonas acroporae TaxID=1701104 RepID=UPI003D7B9DAC
MTEFVTYQGDALAQLAELPSEYYEAVITDPPYSSGGTFRSDRQQATGQKYTQTGKPVELMKAIVQVCPEGGTVLDPLTHSASLTT